MSRIISAPISLIAVLVIIQTGSCSKDDLSNAPRITSISPSFGGSGRRIVIKSNDAFTGNVSDQTVMFSKSIAQVIDVTPSSMTVRVPDNAGTGKVTVTSGDNTMQGPVFEYVTPASVEYFIRFKEDGVMVEGIAATDTNPGENCVITDGGLCHEIVFFIQGHAKEAYFILNFDHNNTTETLSSLKGVSIPIRPRATLPAVAFGFNVIDGSYISDDAQQVGGSFKITTLNYHNSFVSDYDVYDAEGTFECVIFDKYHNETSVITEGTFRIPIAAMVE